MNGNNNPIGVFDSGIGGLTVLKELTLKLPFENFIYVGDTARVPYGTKSKETITHYASQIIEFLLSKNVKLIVVACNTVSSNSLNILKRKYKLPIIGVIEPGVKKAISITKNKRVGVIGTKATINSHTYKKFLKKEKIKTFEKACPLFVPLVEEGWFDNEITQLVAKEYLNDFKDKDIDTLILGCTHYPMLIPVIKRVLDNVNIINSAEAVSLETEEVLFKNKLLTSNKTKGKVEYYFTDLTELVLEISEKILETQLQNVNKIFFP